MIRALAALALMTAPTLAADLTCHNPANWRDLMPPARYRHEPTRPFIWVDHDLMRAMNGAFDPRVQSLGHYSVRTGLIFICRGLTGKTLWAVRMHEEAHAMGWRHPRR